MPSDLRLRPMSANRHYSYRAGFGIIAELIGGILMYPAFIQICTSISDAFMMSMGIQEVIQMNRTGRYAMAVVASSVAAYGSLATGVIIGAYATQRGVPSGLVIAMIIGLVASVAIPAFIVKKLLVDHW